MKTSRKQKNIKKRSYTKPIVEHIKLDNEISIFMISPPPDPGGKLETDHFSINPFK